MLKKYSQIGPINIILHYDSNNQLADFVSTELEAIENSISSNTDIEIYFINEASEVKYTPSHYSAKEAFHFNDNTIFVGQNKFIKYWVKGLNYSSNPLKIYVHKKQTKFYTKDYSIAESFMTYNIFWHLFYFALLKKEASFIHSSVLSFNGTTIGITGTGGAGKTSVLFKMLEHSKSKYLSEDFGILDKAGNVYYNPKKISVYKSDLQNNQKLLKNYIQHNLSAKERFQWFYREKLLKITPRKKVAPRAILEEQKILKSGKLNFLFYLIRTNQSELTIQDANTEDLAQRCLMVIQRETYRIRQCLRLVLANKDVSFEYPTLKSIDNRNTEILVQGFNQIQKKYVYVPRKVSPKRLSDFIINNI